MTEPAAPRGAGTERVITLLRSAAGIAGILLISAALLADVIRGGSGFGRGQLLLVTAGILLVLVAVAGRRFGAGYRTAAIILLNTIVLVSVIELGATIASWFFARPPTDPGTAYRQRVERLSYYTSRPWSQAFWAEHWQVESAQRYEPFVVWRSVPAKGRYVNVDEHGRRVTPGSECRAGDRRIVVFGGSAVWGWGAPDSATIPTHLQQILRRRNVAACVANYGQNAYVSTQELTELVRLLQSGPVPRLAIFYSGYNDVYATLLNGSSRGHISDAAVARRFHREAPEPDPLWRQALERTQTWLLLQRLATKPPSDAGFAAQAEHGGTRLDTLAEAALTTYLANVRLARALGREYEFDVIHIWQPVLTLGHKVLTEEEEQMRRALGDIEKLVALIHDRIADDDVGIYDFSDLFDDRTSLTWIDVVHPTPDGNRIVAERIADLLSGGPAAVANL